LSDGGAIVVGMDQRVHFITIATADLDAVRAFYRDGLGWAPLLDVPGEIVFFQVGPGLMLGLFDAASFVADQGGGDVDSLGVAGLTLSTNVGSATEVEPAFAAAVRAGGRVVKEPQAASFGGVHAHVAGPDGLVWEIAYNPGWRVGDDGTVVLDAP
jgi:catechol 2,3-dioxygenase-like lactoylglutathione lyase family enzyme